MPPSILDSLCSLLRTDGLPEPPPQQGWGGEGEEEEEGAPQEPGDNLVDAATIRNIGRSLELDLYFSDMDGRLLRACTPPPPEPSTATSTTTSFHHHRSLSLYDDTPIGLDQFIALLPTVLQKCEVRHLKKCEPIKALLKRLVLRPEEVDQYAFWDPSKLYTRNLVATDGKNYTILLLCWNPGKESPIHDHPCEGCWVKTVQGTVKETIYENSKEKGGLVPVRENIFHPDELSYIEDSLGFHKVGNMDPEIKAITLHVYIPPPKSCRIWLTANTRLGEAMTVPVCYFSAYGRRIDNTPESSLTSGNPTMAATPVNPSAPPDSPTLDDDDDHHHSPAAASSSSSSSP